MLCDVVNFLWIYYKDLGELKVNVGPGANAVRRALVTALDCGTCVVPEGWGMLLCVQGMLETAVLSPGRVWSGISLMVPLCCLP